MIRLTRLRQADPLYINPDHIERLDRHHETVVHLLNGVEYVVVESPEEIMEQVTLLRARVIATAARMVSEQQGVPASAVTHVEFVAAAPGLPTVLEIDDLDGVVEDSGSTQHTPHPAPDVEGV